MKNIIFNIIEEIQKYKTERILKSNRPFHASNRF